MLGQRPFIKKKSHHKTDKTSLWKMKNTVKRFSPSDVVAGEGREELTRLEPPLPPSGKGNPTPTVKVINEFNFSAVIMDLEMTTTTSRRKTRKVEERRFTFWEKRGFSNYTLPQPPTLGVPTSSSFSKLVRTTDSSRERNSLSWPYVSSIDTRAIIYE